MSSLPFRKFLAIAAVIMLTACGSNKSSEVATKSVDTFHQQLNDSKFTEIYSTTAPALKTATKEADFVKLLQVVHTKLGNVKSTTYNGSNVSWLNGATIIVLTHKTVFDRGSAIERFNFVATDDAATLQGYSINSNELITN